jgi:hypothetical protein
LVLEFCWRETCNRTSWFVLLVIFIWGRLRSRLHLTPLLMRAHLLALRRTTSNEPIRVLNCQVVVGDPNTSRGTHAHAPFGAVVFIALEWPRRRSDIALRNRGGRRRDGG